MRITPLSSKPPPAIAMIDPPPPVYDTSSIHQSAAGAPSISNIAITNSHDDEAGSSAITSVHQAEPSQRWAHELPRIRNGIMTQAPSQNHPRMLKNHCLSARHLMLAKPYPSL